MKDQKNIDGLAEVLEIENYWQNRKAQKATSEIGNLEKELRSKICFLSKKVAFMFRCEDNDVLRLDILECIINSRLTIDTLNIELNRNGQRLYSEGRTVEEMLKIESEKANKSYNDLLKDKRNGK